MFHHRLTLTGTDDALTGAGAELVAMGATPIGEWCFITSRDDDASIWRTFAENNPSVRLSVDTFDEFEDEFVQTIVGGRSITTLAGRACSQKPSGASTKAASRFRRSC